jgi:hypothetical protein
VGCHAGTADDGCEAFVPGGEANSATAAGLRCADMTLTSASMP